MQNPDLKGFGAKPQLRALPSNSHFTDIRVTSVTRFAPARLETGISGVAIALLIIALWAISIGLLLSRVTVEQNLWDHIEWKAIAILWQTFLYTGLFITAHDAMHGAVSPRYPQVNYAIGSISLLFYGFFSYAQLQKTHRQHHCYPASDSDPDFHNGKHKNAIAWYFYFMQRYWSWYRFLGLVMAYQLMHRLFYITEANLALFWIIPSLLSSIQLFYFGTFLPHREPIEGYTNSFRTQSVYRPFLWSFITCYHFGYHQEHHMYPDLPWWKLPMSKQLNL